MTRSTRENLIIGVATILIAAAVISFFTNISNAASKDDLDKTKVELKSFTVNKIKEYAAKDSIRDIRRNEKFDKMEESIEFMFLRELKKADEELYLHELEKAKYNENKNKMNSL